MAHITAHGSCVRYSLDESEITHPRGLEIAIEGFAGDVGGVTPVQVFVEVYNGQLQVHVWDGGEDPAQTIIIPRLLVGVESN